jgi:hypothetical protein
MLARTAHVASQLPSLEQQYGSSLHTKLQQAESEQNGVSAATQQSLVLVPHAGGGGAFGVIWSCPAPALVTSNPPTAIL